MKKKTSGLRGEKMRTYIYLMIPGLVLYSIFFILPILMGIYYSLTDWNGISAGFNFIGLKNYLSIMHDKAFGKVLVFTLKYTVIFVVLAVILSVFLALLLNANIKGRSFFRTAYFLPAILSMLTVSLIFGQIFYRIIPVIGEKLHIEALQMNILATREYAMYGILFVHLWQGVALPTLLFLAGLQTIPTELFEAASLDGATGFQKFRYITISYLLPTLSVVLVLTLKAGLTVFDYIKCLTDGGPGGSTKSIAFLIYQHAFVQNKFSYSISEAIVTGVIVAMVSVIQITLSGRKKVQA